MIDQATMIEMDQQDVLQVLETVLASKRGYVFRRPAPDEPIVLLVSGGIDSTIALARLALQHHGAIHPVYVARGARTEAKELAAASHYVKLIRRAHGQVAEIEIVRSTIPPASLKQHIGIERLSTLGHSMRNFVIQSVGVQFAVHKNAETGMDIRTVFTALSPDDDFPHCRLVALRTATIAACIDNYDWTWQVTSPLLEQAMWGWHHKAASLRWAFAHGLNLDRTYTCTEDGDKSCGTCSACHARRVAFERAKSDAALCC